MSLTGHWVTTVATRHVRRRRGKRMVFYSPPTLSVESQVEMIACGRIGLVSGIQIYRTPVK